MHRKKVYVYMNTVRSDIVVKNLSNEVASLYVLYR